MEHTKFKRNSLHFKIYVVGSKNNCDKKEEYKRKQHMQGDEQRRKYRC